LATAWELRQKEFAKQAKEKALVRGVTGTLAQGAARYAISQEIARTGTSATATAGLWATTINLVGALGIGAWQYFSSKKRLKLKTRLTRKQKAQVTGIDDLLTEINEVGSVVVQEHGIDPTTPEFEKVLYDNLFETIGYRGNCNMTAWIPGSKKPRPIWFYVKQNGRVLEPVNMDAVPANISAHWYTNCKGLKDGWANTYQDLLIQQGRVQELEAFQQTREKGVKILRAVFGISFAILLFFVIKYGLTIK
jgi:hypothetical protein